MEAPVIRPQDIPEEKIPLGLVTPHARCLLHAHQFEWVSRCPKEVDKHVFLRQLTARGVIASRQISIRLPLESGPDEVLEAIFEAGWNEGRDFVGKAYTDFLVAAKAPPFPSLPPKI